MTVPAMDIRGFLFVVAVLMTLDYFHIGDTTYVWNTLGLLVLFGLPLRAIITAILDLVNPRTDKLKVIGAIGLCFVFPPFLWLYGIMGSVDKGAA